MEKIMKLIEDNGLSEVELSSVQGGSVERDSVVKSKRWHHVMANIGLTKNGMPGAECTMNTAKLPPDPN